MLYSLYFVRTLKIYKMKEKINLKEDFLVLKGRERVIRKYESSDSIFCKVKIVGYVENNNKFLIGEIDKEHGVTSHFSKKRMYDIIQDYSENKEYLYVNIDKILPPKTKKREKEEQFYL